MCSWKPCEANGALSGWNATIVRRTNATLHELRSMCVATPCEYCMLLGARWLAHVTSLPLSSSAGNYTHLADASSTFQGCVASNYDRVCPCSIEADDAQALAADCGEEFIDKDLGDVLDTCASWQLEPCPLCATGHGAGCAWPSHTFRLLGFHVQVHQSRPTWTCCMIVS